MSQDDVFAASESDRWYARNREALGAIDVATDPVLRLLEAYAVRPTRALEVGGANGYRIAELMRRTGCAGTLVEPSAQAIADGQARYPQLSFHRGESRALPVSGPFDLVIVNFVLHWIDRSTLFRTMAELDRVLADGGFLVIGDFDPAGPTKVPYHHLPDQEIYTYKQDYASIFTTSALYHRVGAHTTDSGRMSATVDPDRRSIVTLLCKQLSAGYATRSFDPKGR